VVARFEKMVRRRDARDPNLRIVRAAGTGGAGEARSAGGSSGRVEKAGGRPKQGPKFGTKPKRPFASKRKGRA
jgi:hypothetical protein